jgi:hypothetical protein
MNTTEAEQHFHALESLRAPGVTTEGRELYSTLLKAEKRCHKICLADSPTEKQIIKYAKGLLFLHDALPSQ